VSYPWARKEQANKDSTVSLSYSQLHTNLRTTYLLHLSTLNTGSLHSSQLIYLPLCLSVTYVSTFSSASKMRLPYVPNPPPATSEEENQIITRIQARRAPRTLQALDLTLLHSPPVADGWNSFLGAVRTRTTLSPAIRELAICRVAVCNEAWYEWAHHAPLARNEGGLGEAAIEMIKRPRDELDVLGKGGEERDGARRDGARRDGLGDKEWAVLLYADEMTRKVHVSDATFEMLRAVCSEREVVEITATVSFYPSSPLRISSFIVDIFPDVMFPERRYTNHSCATRLPPITASVGSSLH